MANPRGERPAMADYGVGRPDWQALPWSWAAERLVANKNYWFVSVSGGGRPHALPVWGVWDDGEARLGFSCSPHARKGRNLAANPQAVVMVDSTVECISVEGRAAAVTDDARREQWIERFLAKYLSEAPTLTAEFYRPHLTVEFVPDRAFAIIERDDEFSTRATRWVF